MLCHIVMVGMLVALYFVAQPHLGWTYLSGVTAIAALLAYDAWLGMGKKCAFYYYEVSDGEDTLMFLPTHYVDISGRRVLCACFADVG